MDWWIVRTWRVVCCFSRCYACNACSYPQKTQTTSQAKAQAIHYCQKSCKPPQILPNPPQKTLPKPFPNLPKSKENCIAATKTMKLHWKLPSVNVPHPLGCHFGCPKPPKRGPRASQKLPKSSPKREKIDVQKQVVSRLDIFMIFTWFWMVFCIIFGSQNITKLLRHNFCENLKNIDFTMEKLIFSRFRRFET